MKATWEKIEKNQGVLTVEVEAEKVAVALEQAFKKVVKKVNVPGFRKGKVPRSMFESRYGVESLYQDALDILLPEAYAAAVEEVKIDPVDRPEVDVQEMGKGQALKFTAKVTVRPEVKLGEYKGIEIEEKAADVSEEDIAAELNRLQQRHAELTVIEEGTAENGDVTSIDFEGFKDGVAFEGGKGDNYSLELGSNSFIPGFEEQVVGMTIGESKDIEVTFPENYHAEELKGQPVVFKVTLNSLKRKNLPALDDEFAKDVSEFETLDEYKADIKTRLLSQKEQSLKVEKENAVVEKLVQASEVEVPEIMFENELDNMMKDFTNRLQSQGMNLELYTQFTGQTEDVLKSQMRPDAEKRVLGNLVLEAVSKAENIEVSEEELTEELEKMSQTYNRPMEEVRAIFKANGMLAQLQDEMAIRKTVEFLVSNSVAKA